MSIEKRYYKEVQQKIRRHVKGHVKLTTVKLIEHQIELISISLELQKTEALEINVPIKTKKYPAKKSAAFPTNDEPIMLNQGGANQMHTCFQTNYKCQSTIINWSRQDIVGKVALARDLRRCFLRDEVEYCLSTSRKKVEEMH